MRYKVTATIDGKRKYFYGQTKREAERTRKEYLTKVNQEKFLFKTIANEWWDFKQSEIAYNTTKSYKPALERAIKEFGEDDLKEIKPSDISEFIRWFSRGNRADKTVRTQLMVINLIYKYAINYMGINISNPCRDITIPKNLTKVKVHSPSADVINTIKNADESVCKSMAMFFMLTGLRKGELLCLTSDDIKDGIITVNKSVYWDNNKPFLKKPKTEKGVRVVPVLKALEPYIPEKDGIIFDENGKLMRDSYFQKRWYKWCKELDIKCTPHQLRHQYASLLYEHFSNGNSVDFKIIQQLLGHAQISTTMDIYADILNQKKKFESMYNLDVTT